MVAVLQAMLAVCRGYKFENRIFKLFIGGSTASKACSMQGYKFKNKILNYLLVAVLQARLAVCKGYKMKRVLYCVFSILITYILQVTVFSYFEIAGIRPNLLLMITCITGFIMGGKMGLAEGFFSGLLIDLMAGGTVGFTALIYMYAGALNGFFYKDYVKEELFLPMALVAVSTFMYEFLYFIFYFLLQNKLRLSYYLARIILPEVIYTVLMTLLAYVFIYFIIRKVEQSKKRRTLISA